MRDEITKRSIYKKEGVRFYILVYPDGKVKMFDLAKDEEIETIELQTSCGDVRLEKEEIEKEVV